MPRTLGVLVAGGVGSRLGLGVPKALVRLGGETLLARSIATLAAVCDEVVVTAPASLAPTLAPEIAPAPGGTRAHRIGFRADAASGRGGPLAGLVSGLAGAAFDRVVVLGVDLPFMRSALLAALTARLAGHHAVVPMPGGIPQPLAAAYAGEACAILAGAFAAGERAPTRALASLDVLSLDDDQLVRLPGGLDNFFNLNTSADLAEAERRLATRGVAR